MRLLMRSLALVSLFSACHSPGTGPVALFDPGGGFFDTPWPSDARVQADGAPDWSTFPNPNDIGLLDTFLQAGMRQPGAANNAAIWFKLDGDLDLDRLPGPASSDEVTSPIQLLDVDPRSPEYGRRIPIHWESFPLGGAYVDAGVLGLAPLAGFPLRPLTTYAAVLTTTIAQPDPDLSSAWDADDAWSRALRPLRQSLPVFGLRERDIAAATVFTTGAPTDGLDHVARFLRERVSPPAPTVTLEHLADLADYRVYRSNYTTPIFMGGEAPWASEGGSFVFRDDGLPEIQRWELMRLSVVTPVDLSQTPPDGWPVLVSLHGTGGDYRSFCNSSSEMEIATWMAGIGAVGLSFDLPLHGARATDDTIIDLHSFNVLQPDSAVHIHRQGAADLLYLLDGIAAGMVSFLTPEGQPIPLDRSRIAVIGHSQGGITAALALPWIGDQVTGAVLSGTGGLLAITAVERDNDYDFPGLIRDLLQFEEQEQLTELHPLLGLVQAIVEPTDPINYGRSWFSEPVSDFATRPTPVLLTTGLRDDMTPFRTAEALGAAAGLPFVGTRYSASPGSVLKGLPTLRLPVEDDVDTWSGEPITAGMSQWDDGTHFVIFEEEGARDLVRNFVWEALNGHPRIVDGEPAAP